MATRKAVKHRLVFRILLVLLAVLIAAAAVLYYLNLFSYTNLADQESQENLQNLLLENGIPRENIDLLIRQINTFYSTPYSGIVEEGWEYASIPFFSYRDKDGFTHLDTQPDNLINCRMTAFLVLKDQLHFAQTAVSPSEEKDPQSRTVLSEETDLENYDRLFANLEDTIIASSDTMAEQIKQYWKAAGITFPEGNVRLIMACGSSGELTQNFHTAAAIYDDDCVWLLEKYDPIHPYQLSRFDSEEKMIRYMAKRVYDVEYAAVFSNDTCLWTA